MTGTRTWGTRPPRSGGGRAGLEGGREVRGGGGFRWLSEGALDRGGEGLGARLLELRDRGGAPGQRRGFVKPLSRGGRCRAVCLGEREKERPGDAGLPARWSGWQGHGPLPLRGAWPILRRLAAALSRRPLHRLRPKLRPALRTVVPGRACARDCGHRCICRASRTRRTPCCLACHCSAQRCGKKFGET